MAQNQVLSVSKAMKILDLLGESGRPLSLTEISEYTQWPKSTVHALLSTMREFSMVGQSASDGKYMLGYHVFELGCSVCNSWDVVKLAHSHMLHIASCFHHSTYLARLMDDRLILVACEEPNDGFRVYDEVGSRLPLHCTSQGKAILANRSTAQVKYLLEQTGLQAYTENSITDMEAFLSTLPEIKAKGYALEKGEYCNGLYSYAAPIFDRDGSCEYALAYAGPYQVMDPFGREQETVRDEVINAAENISEQLGWRSERKKEEI